MKRIIVSVWLFCLMFLSVTATALAASPWDKEDVDIFHNWTIKFSDEIDPQTVNARNINVKQDFHSVDGVNVYVNADNRSVTVTAPKEGYQPGNRYVLYISDEVKSRHKKNLLDETTMQFTTKQKNQAPVLIQAIPNQVIMTGQSASLNLLDYFSDEDYDDSLVFSATAGAIQNNQWTYFGEEATFTPVTMTATDELGESVSSVFYVTVEQEKEQIQEDTLYNRIYSALINVEPEVNVSKFTTSSKVAFEALKNIMKDHPEIYYFEYEGSLFWTNGRFELKYKFPKSEILATTNLLEQTAEKIISENIYAGMTDFEKIKAIHDYVVLNTAYDYENYLNGTVPDASYNIHGLLLNGTAVCDGYAKTMVYLLKKINMDVLHVSGTGNGGNHAWNKVKVDGQWYNMDVTWDDPVPNKEGYVRYNYFLIPDNKLDDDHSWDNSNLPKAADTKYLYMADMWASSLVDGYYYYSSNTDNQKLYKIKADGTEKTKMLDKVVNELVVSGDWIYFSNYSYGGYLFKVKTDGTNLEQLTDFHVINLQLNNSTLRYTDGKGLKQYNLEVL